MRICSSQIQNKQIHIVCIFFFLLPSYSPSSLSSSLLLSFSPSLLLPSPRSPLCSLSPSLSPSLFSSLLLSSPLTSYTRNLQAFEGNHAIHYRYRLEGKGRGKQGDHAKVLENICSVFLILHLRFKYFLFFLAFISPKSPIGCDLKKINNNILAMII